MSMHMLAFVGLGIGFVLMGAGLYALTLRKPKALPPLPNKTQLREQAALIEETKKLRIGAMAIAGFGVLLALFGLY